MDVTEFEEYLPEGCPPQDTAVCEGVWFRLVHSNPPAESDFRTYFEQDKRPEANPCLRCGLSCFSSREAAEALMERFPKIGEFVAHGELSSTEGVVQQTGNDEAHHTWWPARGISRHAFFEVEK